MGAVELLWTRFDVEREIAATMGEPLNTILDSGMLRVSEGGFIAKASFFAYIQLWDAKKAVRVLINTKQIVQERKRSKL